jgi:hypothetical protein
MTRRARKVWTIDIVIFYSTAGEFGERWSADYSWIQVRGRSSPALRWLRHYL